MTYIIIDFEATCCDRGTVPREEMEIIEIGAVALIEEGPDIQSEYQSFICPVRHPQLTPFCTKLTTITQDMVDAAPSFAEVLGKFSTWITSFDTPVFCSWGDYDRKQLKQDCAYHKVPYPFDDQHLNIKKRFAKNLNRRKAVGLGQAIRLVNLPFEGTAHRGIDDAKNMARLSPWIFEKDAGPPTT